MVFRWSFKPLTVSQVGNGDSACASATKSNCNSNSRSRIEMSKNRSTESIYRGNFGYMERIAGCSLKDVPRFSEDYQVDE